MRQKKKDFHFQHFEKICMAKQCSGKTVQSVTVDGIEGERERSVAGGTVQSKTQATMTGKEARNNMSVPGCPYAIAQAMGNNESELAI